MTPAEERQSLDEGGFRWRLRPGVPAELASAVLSLRDAPGQAAVIKANPSRSVFRFDAGPGVCYVKWHRFRGLLDAIGNALRGARAEREWRMALCLREAGIHTPEPMLMGVRRRYGLPVETVLVMREVLGVALKEEFPALMAARSGEAARRRHELARRLGTLVRTLHEGHISHPDMHGGNFLVTEPDRSLCLIDLHSARQFDALPGGERSQDLAFLHGTMLLRGSTRADRLRFSRAYLGESWTRGAARRIEAESDRRFEVMRRRRLRSRSRRCVVKSSVFTNERTDLGRVYRKREMSMDQIRLAIDAHHGVVDGRADGQVMKRDRKTTVTIFPWDGALDASELCVKEFIRPGLLMRLLPKWLRHRPAMRAWRASLGLQVRGVPAPEALALVIGKGRSSYVVMRTVANAVPLDIYLRKRMGPDRTPAERRAFTSEAARFLIEFLEAQVHHRDLKARNVLVREPEAGRWEFFLLDLDAIGFPRRLRIETKLLNLAQLNASTPLTFTWTDRLRFLRHVAAREPAIARRSSMEEIGRLTRTRDLRWHP